MENNNTKTQKAVCQGRQKQESSPRVGKQVQSAHSKLKNTKTLAKRHKLLALASKIRKDMKIGKKKTGQNTVLKYTQKQKLLRQEAGKGQRQRA